MKINKRNIKYIIFQQDVFQKEKDLVINKIINFETGSQEFISADKWPWNGVSNHYWRSRYSDSRDKYGYRKRQFLEVKYAKYKNKFGYLLSWGMEK